MNYIQYTQWNQNIFLVDMTRELTRPFSELMTKWIKKFLKQGKKILLINNKKWRSSWLMCHDCGHIPQCDQCAISLARHKNEHQELFGICHICKTHYTLPKTCNECDSKKVSLFGVGNQQLMSMVSDEFWVKPLLIEANVANSVNKIKKLKASITNHTQMIIGTSLLTTALETWRPDIVCIVSADIGLHSPHFAARYNNFLFLHDVIQTYQDAEIILQSYKVEEGSIKHACLWNLDQMLETELERRKEYQYPPLVDLCSIMYKHEIEKSVYTTVHKLYQELLYLREQYEMKDLEIYATPPSMYKMYGKYRYQIILKGSDLRNFMEIAYSKFSIPRRWFKVDWEPSFL